VRQRSARYWRLNAGLTVDQLAVMARVSRPSVMRLERGEGQPLGSIVFAVAAVLGIAPGMISLDSGPEADRDGEPVSLAGCRESLELERSDVAASLKIPLAVIKRAEDGASIGLGYAKRLSDFYGVRVTDWYPAAEERAAA
jgi:transcriptional regulator with XRE-family HTH domain